MLDKNISNFKDLHNLEPYKCYTIKRFFINNEDKGNAKPIAVLKDNTLIRLSHLPLDQFKKVISSKTYMWVQSVDDNLAFMLFKDTRLCVLWIYDYSQN